MNAPAPTQSNTLHVEINLDGLRGRIQSSLQTVVNLVALCMKGDVGGPEDEIALPTDGMGVTFQSRMRWTTEERNDRRNTWLCGCALRDAIEEFSEFLGEARQVLAFWRMVGTPEQNVLITTDAYNDWIGAGAQKFMDLSFPDKIDLFNKEFGLDVEPVLLEQVKSINQVRNCLVHRRGLVTPKDTKKAEQLVLKWRELSALFRGADGVERPLVRGQIGPGDLFVRIQDRQREFDLGAEIRFTIDELTSLLWGIYLCAEAVVMATSKIGVDAGFLKEAQPKPGAMQ